ncbi:MAG: adaptor protein MecA [Lachnospiraceae bacterium]|nr:adaptor protein MecA [Candidatus Colinaster scatohippi]
MKIEKLNDRQIRCTLTKADLADRQLKLSELAYGTEKAKALFKDMMQQAALKFGFEAEDIPLMIEAVPLNSDCIVLIITKVDDPEELDTRFSRFSPSVIDDEGDDSDNEMDVLDHSGESSDLAINNEIMDLFNHITKQAADIIGDAAEISVSVSEAKPANKDKKSAPDNVSKIFSFASIYDIFKPANAVRNLYAGNNSLYKDHASGRYLLVVTKDGEDKESFNKTCNILSEYGTLERLTSVSEAYFSEHYKLVIADTALQNLSKV